MLPELEKLKEAAEESGAGREELRAYGLAMKRAVTEYFGLLIDLRTLPPSAEELAESVVNPVGADYDDYKLNWDAQNTNPWYQVTLRSVTRGAHEYLLVHRNPNSTHNHVNLHNRRSSVLMMVAGDAAKTAHPNTALGLVIHHN
jgi:hypothetical protein